MCGRVGVPVGVDNSAAEVTLNEVLGMASRPNMYLLLGVRRCSIGLWFLGRDVGREEYDRPVRL